MSDSNTNEPKRDITQYHPAVQEVLRFFEYDHLKDGMLRNVSKRIRRRGLRDGQQPGRSRAHRWAAQAPRGQGLLRRAALPKRAKETP